MPEDTLNVIGVENNLFGLLISGSRPDADGHVEEPVLLRCLMKALWGLLELQPVNRNVLPVWHTGKKTTLYVYCCLCTNIFWDLVTEGAFCTYVFTQTHYTSILF